jgi:hypothetical protein
MEPQVEDEEEDDDASVVDDDADPDPTPSTPSTSTATATATATNVARPKKKRKKQDDASYVKDLQEALKRSADLQAEVATQIVGGTDKRSKERHQWGGWMSSCMQQIDNSLWPRWVSNCIFLDCTQYSVHDSTVKYIVQ